MSRIAIFVFYDFQGLVDDYVVFLLKEVLSSCDKLIICINGYIDENQKSKLSRVINYVIERDNKVDDAGAYKDVIRQLVANGE
ncbi:MAG: hypothetical protein K5900_14165, partial [Butyrivibrio sp.]|nr:hypothetical protein [Butyrivibrio sp.]